MKPLLSLVLIFIIPSSASALMCIQCTSPNNPTCLFPNTIQCGQDEMCFNAFITESDGSQRIYRDCAGQSVCPDLGSRSLEVNVGGLNTIANTECCDADQCNSATLVFPALQPLNGRMCPGTEPSSATFFETVACKGSEDTCFSGTAVQAGSQVTIGGCGTSQVCDVTGAIQELPFIDAGFIPAPLACAAITTTTVEPTTTTNAPLPGNTPPPTTVTGAFTFNTEPTIKPTPSPEVLEQIKELVLKLKALSAAIKLELLQQNQLVLLQLHLQLLDYQQQLLVQQEALPVGHHHQLSLYYQHCLLVNHQQLLLHQIHLSLCGQQHLLQLFSHQQRVLHRLQELLHGHHSHLLPHYHSYLLHKPLPTTEAPTTAS